MESSQKSSLLPWMSSRIGISFMRATRSRTSWFCGMKLRGHVGVYLTKGLRYGIRHSLAYPMAWAVPESGMPATQSTSTSSFLARAAPQRLRTSSTLRPS